VKDHIGLAQTYELSKFNCGNVELVKFERTAKRARDRQIGKRSS
jgi:hypothetical protein